MFRAYFYRLIRSPLFYAAAAGTALICLTRRTEGVPDVTHEIENIIFFDTMRRLIAVFSALPFAANFADEWSHGVSKNCISRCGTGRYAAANVIFTFFSSFLSVAAGIALYVLISLLRMPLGSGSGVMPYNALLQAGHPLLYIAALSLPMAASCAMWSVMGLTLSAFMPNKYVALCAPFVLSLAVEHFTDMLPRPVDLYYVTHSLLNWESGALQFAYSIGLFAVISAVLGIIFTLKVRRRVRNELT